MKGAVFIALNDMIEKNYGMQTWEAILEKVAPSSGGIYASAHSYEDSEMLTFVDVISEHLKLSKSDVKRAFGEYLFTELDSKFPVFRKVQPTFFSFLSSIEGVIHKEVEKLYHDAHLPQIRCTAVNNQHMQMYYTSPRKLCLLAEGLIYGAAKQYDVAIDIIQNTCMHTGEDHCLIDIRIL
ncbi:heme NO-binding domain-containing protein [Teredinibacter purpureus]|uniref:heme NO-binding domain-containing protein n=1 Tax=Teredinibacter purpureus TaxID=2731756 RepID=UPI0005F78875|nr:heme NO-binding domain-containing protein [Teredinibacter purpureus]